MYLIKDAQGFSGGSAIKNLPANAEDTDSVPGLGGSPGEGNGCDGKGRILLPVPPGPSPAETNLPVLFLPSLNILPPQHFQN